MQPSQGVEPNAGVQFMGERFACWRDVQIEVFLSLLDQAGKSGVLRSAVHALLIHSLPMASILGAWLQGLSAPGVFEDEANLQLMALLANDVGSGSPESSRFDHFKILLRQAGLTAYALTPFEISTLRGIPDDAFEAPALLLAMSRRSDSFAPELCGIDLAFRSLGRLPCWDALGKMEQGLDVARLNLAALTLAQAENGALALSQALAQQAARDADWMRRMVWGANWLFAALERCNEMLLAACRVAISPLQAMAQLMRERAREAAVYHQAYRLDGRSLSDWFKEAAQDPWPFLAALSRSPLIVPGNSAKSRLVTSLIAPAGRMFRIFSEEDLRIICRWIDSLPQAQQEAAVQGPAVSVQAAVPLDMRDEDAGGFPSGLREAYFMLQGRALAPGMRTFARGYVERWLARSRRSLRGSRRALPLQWSAGGLRAWLLEQHERHGLEFEQSSTADMPTREEVVDSTLQLAPLTLIDGAWLQGFTDVALASSQTGYALFQTYWDELGNGRYVWNHPKIYRDVLRQMGIELAPTATREFADDARLRDASFLLPVYWLCLGKFPITFMPEILGMNLAMELSGVGGSYRSARRFLQHYGFSTEFVDIHNTIDNVSTGHSAWAADAIDAHMRSFGSASEDVLARHWERIRVGYESLAPRSDRSTRILRWLGFKAAGDSMPRRPRVNRPAVYFHHAAIGSFV